uniref:Putative RdRp n=1 Tax=Linepithema humile narna-like virus 1 TaxID=2259777 RepID=A0A2Z4Z3E0_9VIRU|nr:putative RdRp [Linepithema humile narna-like virus 1]
MTASLRVYRWTLSTDITAWPVTPGVGGVGSWISVIPGPATPCVEHMTDRRAIWTAVAITLTAVNPKGYRNIIPPKLLAKWVLRAPVQTIVKGLKSLAHEYRSKAVLGGPLHFVPEVPLVFQKWLKGHVCHATQYAQLGRLGRLMPKPWQKITSKAVHEWIRVNTRRPDGPIHEPSVDNERMSNDIYRFAHEFATQRKDRLTTEVNFTPSESASTFMTSMSEGGRLKEMMNDARDLIGEFAFDETIVNLAAREGGYKPPPRAQCGMQPVLDELILENQIQMADSKEFSPRVIGVPEYGWKTRVLTLFPNYALTPGDLIRQQLWPLVSEEEWLDADRVPSWNLFNNMLSRSLDRVGTWVSCDLSNATDYVPHLYCKALWAGIYDALGVSEGSWVRRYTEKMFSPMVIAGTKGRITFRGTQMGTPLSFMTLCLLHRFAVVRSGFEYCPHLIRGDDLIGCFHKPRIYMGMLEELGFKINKAKTFLSTIGGTFAERTFRAERKLIKNVRHGYFFSHRKVTAGQWAYTRATLLQDIPLRGLIKVATTGPNRYRSKLLMLSEIVENVAMGFRPKRRALIRRLATQGRGDILIAALKSGIPLSLPREVGGAGLPTVSEILRDRIYIDLETRRRLGWMISHVPKGPQLVAKLRRRASGGLIGFTERYLEGIKNISLGLRVPVTEPERTAHYLAAKRRTIHLKPWEVVHRPPCSFREWGRTFRSFGKVGPRWALGGDRLSLVSDRLKVATACIVYVPIYQGFRGPIRRISDGIWTEDPGQNEGYRHQPSDCSAMS